MKIMLLNGPNLNMDRHAGTEYLRPHGHMKK